MPSIVDPATHRGGAGTVTRALLRVLASPPLTAETQVLFPASARRRFHRARQVASLARSLVSSLPSKPLLTHSKRFRRDVQRHLRNEHFDLVIVNGSDLLWVLPYLSKNIPRVLIAHNIEHQLFRSQIDCLFPVTSFLRSCLIRDCDQLRDFEISGIRRVHNIIFLSTRDAEFCHDHNRDLNSLTVPPIFDGARTRSRRSPESCDGLQIGFMGNFAWWPNREGFRWFVTQVLPYLSAGIRLHLFGDKSFATRSADPRIVRHGFVEDPQDIWSLCDFLICPIRFGGGVNVKFAEAVYNQMPVVATPFAARGLPLEQDPGIVLLDNAEEWVGFLNSSAALELRSRFLPTHIADAFAMRLQTTRIHEFVQNSVLA